MQMNNLMGPFIFLGDGRLGQAIYAHMCAQSLTDLEKYVLLHYLALPKPDEARRAYRKATSPEREAARRAVMVKFPKEWPPPESGGGHKKYKRGQIHHDEEFGDIKVG